MAELLIYASRRSEALGAEQRAGAWKLYDVECVERDGWNWSETEQNHPDFRLLKWPDALAGELYLYELLRTVEPEWLLGPMNGKYLQTTFFQPRGMYLDWAHPSAPRDVARYVHEPRSASHVVIQARWTMALTLMARRPVIERDPVELVECCRAFRYYQPNVVVPPAIFDSWLADVERRFGDVVA